MPKIYTLEKYNEDPRLEEFARWCALRVAALWVAPPKALNYLETGDADLCHPARNAAGRAENKADESALYLGHVMEGDALADAQFSLSAYRKAASSAYYAAHVRDVAGRAAFFAHQAAHFAQRARFYQSAALRGEMVGDLAQQHEQDAQDAKLHSLFPELEFED